MFAADGNTEFNRGWCFAFWTVEIKKSVIVLSTLEVFWL
jgi:hypothetical protein